MMRTRIFLQVLLIVSLCVLFSVNALAQEGSLKVTITSIESIRQTITDVGPADLKINVRVKNEGLKDIFIFGEKDEGEFDPMYQLLLYDELKGDWASGIYIFWDSLPKDEKIPYRLKSGGHLDFHSITGKGERKKKFKIGVYYAFSKTERPTLIESEEFVVEGVKDLK